MPSLSSSSPQDATNGSNIALIVALFAASTLTGSGTSTNHSLLTNAVAWLSICIYTILRTGIPSLGGVTHSRILSWTAGSLLALASICERAVDRRGIWWAKALLPALAYISFKGGLFGNTPQATSPQSPTTSSKRSRILQGSTRLSLVVTVTSAIALSGSSQSATVVASGLCNALLVVVAFSSLEEASKDAGQSSYNGNGAVISVNGFMSQPAPETKYQENITLVLTKDVATAAASALCLATLASETFSFQSLQSWPVIGTESHSVLGQRILAISYGLSMVIAHVAMKSTLSQVIFQQGTLPVTFTLLSATIFAQVLVGFSILRLWFATLCAAAIYLYLDEPAGPLSFSTEGRRRMRAKRLISLLALFSSIVVVGFYSRSPYLKTKIAWSSPKPSSGLSYGQPSEPSDPLPITNTQIHPVDQLIRDSEAEFQAILGRQSQSLEQAVTEYKRRYGIPPPPNFDKWYDFAVGKGVQLIDDYDTIYHSLLPFWGLKPATIRARVREASGFWDNNLLGLLVRDGSPAHITGGSEWQQEATIGMMKQFSQYLPDMDLAFNIHDEPRVVVPHDELSRYIELAGKNMLAANGSAAPKNEFSPRPRDVNPGKRIDEVKTTRFNVFAHQPTWIPSRSSCSPYSPARALDESTLADNLTAYALGELGFVYNHTAFSDICNSPSFATSHGFFDRPNAFNVVHDSFPIFSQSKMSSFQDIVYPSPWYWYGKVSYDEKKDMDWQEKENKSWWVGSTTGGFSRDGGWRRQHRQQMVRKSNAPDNAKILANVNAKTGKADQDIPNWKVKEVPRQDYKDLMDVHFSHVGQCDPGDCDAQREFFKIVEPADQQDAWKYKYLSDLDGNAFSGRFYAFLQSKSSVFKMAVFREWHEEWIKPWVHYIPLSLRGDDSLESVRYFSGEEEGRVQGVRMAEAGREWAKKVLRNEDFEVWFFRLLLEYGRVIDDNRETIGFGNM